MIKDFAYPTVSLARLLTVLESGSRPSGGVGSIVEGIPSLGGEHLTAEGHFDFKKIRYVPEAFFNKMQRGVIQPRDVLLVKDGATTGKAGFVGEDFPYSEAAVNEHLFILRPKLDLIDPEYLFFFLYSPYGQSQVLKSFQGAAIGGINQGFASRALIPVPPLSEQHHIVSILKQAAALRRLRAEALARTQQLIPALFRQMFGDPAMIPKEWEVVSPDQISSRDKNAIAIGPFGSNLLSSDYRESGIPLVFVRNIREKRFVGKDSRYVTLEKAAELSPHIVRGGDLLVTKMGDPPGDAALYPHNLDPAIITADCIKLTPDLSQITSDYLLAVFNDAYIRRKIAMAARGAAQQKINLTLFKSLRFPKPPYPLQEQFSERAKEMQLTIEAQTDSLRDLEGLYQALLAQAFTGKLTETWRESHADVLIEEVSVLDALLGQPRTIPSITVTNEFIVGTGSSYTRADGTHAIIGQAHRPDARRALGGDQLKVLALAEQTTEYFTATSLRQGTDLRPRVVADTLALLDAMGLIRVAQVSVGPETKPFLITAYRLLRPEDLAGEGE